MNTKVIEIIKNLAIKFKDYDYIYNMCRDRKNYIKYENEEIEPWGELTLSNGFTALPMIYGELQEHFPEEAWEDIGHEYMKLMVKLIEKNGLYNLSMFSGAAGVGLATICVSKNRTRYKKIVNEINNFIQLYFQYYMNMCNEKKYVDSNDYDVIQGLTGLGRYCMIFKDDPRFKKILEDILIYLVKLTQDIEFNNHMIPGWHIGSENQFLKSDKEKYKNGNFNLGLSHGIPGPMLLMSYAYENNIIVDNQEKAIRKIADFLMKFNYKINNSIKWTTVISFEEFINGKIHDKYSRDAWCYGTPGVAYALLKTGKVLNDKKYVELAKSAFHGVMRQDNLEGIFSPTFCHGFCGIMYITYRFYEETNEKEFKDFADDMEEKVLKFYDEKDPFGFSNIELQEKNLKKLDFIGLLDGVVGVILSILAVELGKKTPWDYAFLLS